MQKKSTKKDYSATYKIYRRLRFLRYKKRLLKRKLKEKQAQEKEEKRQIAENLRKQRIAEKKELQLKRKREKEFELEQSLLIKENLRQQELIHKKEEKKRLASLKKEKQEEGKIFKERISKTIKEKKSSEQIRQKNAKKEKKFRRKRRYRLLKFYIKRSMWHFWHGLRNLTPVKIKNWLKKVFAVPEDRMLKKNYYSIAINSLSMFLLSYFSIYVFGQMIKIIVARSFDFKVILFYQKLYYDISVEAWSMDSVKILYSILPLTGLFASAVFLISYILYSQRDSLIRLFYLWGTVHGLNAFFGALFYGTILEQGFGWVISYMYYMDTGKMVFSLISLFGLIAIGSLLAKHFYSSAQHYFNYIDDRNKSYFSYSQIIVPVIFGTIIIALMKIPSDFYFESVDEMWFDLLMTSSIFIILMPMLGMIKSFGPMYFDSEEEVIHSQINRRLVLLTIAFILAWRLILNFGIAIG